jgi:putative phosphoesterase
MKALILSDIHGNLPALEAILGRDGDYDVCLFLGDVVDYGPFPKECIQFLREEMDVGVLGNHDNAIARNVDCGCRGDFKQFSEETRAWHRTLVDEQDLQFLRGLPLLARVQLDGKCALLAQATPQGDLFRYLQEEQLDRAADGVTAEIVMLGHAHIQFKKEVGRSIVLNPGSVGLARDGDGACYALWCDGQIHLRRIEYDVQRTIAALEKAPVSQATKEGLSAILQGAKRR